MLTATISSTLQKKRIKDLGKFQARETHAFPCRRMSIVVFDSDAHEEMTH